MAISQGGGISAYRVFNGLAPAAYPRSAPISVDLTTTTAQRVNLQQARDEDKIEWVQTIYADNSANTAPLIIQCAITNQVITFPPGSQGYLPVLATEPDFVFTSTGAAKIQVQFITVAMPALLWDANTGTAIITANVNLEDVGGVAITLGQKLMAASLPVTFASDQSALAVSQVLAATAKIAQVTIAATNTAQQLPSVVCTQGLQIKAPETGNAATVYIKEDNTVSATTGWSLVNSDGAYSAAPANLDTLWIYGTMGDKIMYNVT